MKTDQALDALERALAEWARHGNEQPLTRWLRRELDSQGAPYRLPISDWHNCLKGVLKAKPYGGVWPSHWDEPISRLIQTIFWFTRRDGIPVTDFDSSTSKLPKTWTTADYANPSRGPCVARLLGNGVPMAKNSHGGNARHGWGGSNRVLDVLRPGWPVDDDFLAIDHRGAIARCQFELFGAGRSWLGPTWEIDANHAATSAPRPLSWISGSSGILAEWSYRAGETKITQSALMLGGRSLALLSILVENPSSLHSNPSLSVSLPRGITASPVDKSRAFLLKPSRTPGSAQVLPIALPSLAYRSDRGAFHAHDDRLVLNQASAGKRSWLPILVSWDSKRHRKAVHWRILSVSESSRNITPDQAFAVRVSWGRDETYVVYRSLAKPARRAFLGHQTTARFLVGLFSADGTVEPILKVD